MVVILFLNDPRGQTTDCARKITYHTRIFIAPSHIFSQVEPGQSIALTKEGEFFIIITITTRK